MKKAFILSSMLVFIGYSAIAQLSLRPQAGILFNTLSYESVQGELNSKAGINIGVDLQIGNTFYVQPGVNFNPVKLQIKDVGNVKVSQLNVPIMIGYKLFEPEGKKAFGLRLFAGPNFAFSINNNIADAVNSITTDDLKQFQLSAIGGAGFDLSIIFVDLGYKIGLTETISPKNGTGANMNAFMINAGVRIGF
jgi:hypothetical protein